MNLRGVYFYFKKKRQIFQRLLQNISLPTEQEWGTQVLGGDEVSFSKPILNFPWLALSYALRRHLIESVVLKGFHCVFPQTLLWTADTFAVRMALVEDAGTSSSSVWSLWQLFIPLKRLHALGSRGGYGRQAREAMALYKEQNKSAGEKDSVRSLNCSQTVDKLPNTRARPTCLPDKDQRPGCITDFSEGFWG